MEEPAGAALFLGSRAVSARVSATSWSPGLRYVTILVTGLSSVCGHCCTPKFTETETSECLTGQGR